MPYLQAQFIETDNLEDTDRAQGGFGSTGTK
jgi:dUTPase